MNPKPSQRDRLLDIGVYAPIGFLLQRDEVVTDLAAAGRRQIAFTRSLGRAALKGIVKSAQASQNRATANAGAPTAKAAPSSAEIANFDDLTAREIVTLTRTADIAQLRWIESRELAGKNRVTVLRAARARQ